MNLAIEEAKKARDIEEVPVGAIVVKDNKVIASAFNLKESLKDATAHAELLAIQKASNTLGQWRLSGCSIYITLEPCIMCSGALINSRVDRVVFGAYDKRFGGCRSLYSILDNGKLNHIIDVVEGVKEKECSNLLSDFFKKRRYQKSIIRRNI